MTGQFIRVPEVARYRGRQSPVANFVVLVVVVTLLDLTSVIVIQERKHRSALVASFAPQPRPLTANSCGFYRASRMKYSTKLSILADVQTSSNSESETSFSSSSVISPKSCVSDAPSSDPDESVIPTDAPSLPVVLGGLSAVFLTLWTAYHQLIPMSAIDSTDVVSSVQGFFAHPQSSLQDLIEQVHEMGPAGLAVFGVMYFLAEVVAIPSTPLTLSAGYLFGLVNGVLVVLVAATCAAVVSFFIGKTFLRSYVETVLLPQNPLFGKIDKAVTREGFSLLLLIRLSPIFPFALSNYLYGASGLKFPDYFWGTLLGFIPGTIGYVYTGMVGQAFTVGGDQMQPWYVYAGGFTLLLAFLKMVTDVARNIIDSIDDADGIADDKNIAP
jgi:uncharacterized membrane protein YdjX (TVP38/TMEM64 family)